MARHYGKKNNKRSNRKMMNKEKSDSMMMPRDSAQNQNMGDETQMYHMGKAYYGPGYGHPSNLPPYPDIKYYPKGKNYLNTGDYPDTIREIDGDEAYNSHTLNAQPSQSKY